MACICFPTLNLLQEIHMEHTCSIFEVHKINLQVELHMYLLLSKKHKIRKAVTACYLHYAIYSL